ncbi:MAG: hypothetical protein JWO92_1058 [Chitinophagaceae bacterium]|nr:hypothetical protein [Chitinophagaceae bacterium]
MNLKLQYYNEPNLTFGYNQKTIDPRDGLILFGPHEPLSPFSVKAGVVGTNEGLTAYKEFVEKINLPIFSTKTIYGTLKDDEISRPSFPGFEAVFNVKWSPIPEVFKPLNQTFIDRTLEEKNKKRRTSALVDLYLERIVNAINDDDSQINIWFVVVPRNIYFKCKPGSAGKDLSAGTRKFLQRSKEGGQTSFLFPGEENYVDDLNKLIDSSSDFHHLLKARLIQEKVRTPVQIILESTLHFRDKYRNLPLDKNMQAHLAWTQSTTLFYKLGNLPWKLADIRDEVCYLGLVFKKTNQITTSNSVCSAAQMFLKDGDGAVFRGNIGLWQSKNQKEFHLDEKSSFELLAMALDDYNDKWKKFPKELFIHGRARFSADEWNGFQRAISERKANTNLVGIVIKDTGGFKLFRDVEGASNYGVMRGMALIINDKEAYLITRGFIPRLNTQMSLEVPNPLHIQIINGEADIDTVIKDVLALTKLNYNACLHGDGLPVTLRFSDTIGSILTATDNWKTEQRKFMYYI